MFINRVSEGFLAICVCILTFPLLGSIALKAQTEFASNDQRAAKVDYLFNTWDRPDKPGWAVGVIQDGNLVYERYFGMANIKKGIEKRITTSS